jgi:hypothetical protein
MCSMPGNRETRKTQSPSAFSARREPKKKQRAFIISLTTVELVNL